MSIEGQRTVVLWDEPTRQRLLDVIEALPMDQLSPWSLTLRAPFKAITSGQRGYYRGTVLRVIGEVTGHEEHELHPLLLDLHADRALIDVHHADYLDARAFTTGEHNTSPEMRCFLARVIRWAAIELGAYVPPPERTL